VIRYRGGCIVNSQSLGSLCLGSAACRPRRSRSAAGKLPTDGGRSRTPVASCDFGLAPVRTGKRTPQTSSRSLRSGATLARARPYALESAGAEKKKPARADLPPISSLLIWCWLPANIMRSADTASALAAKHDDQPTIPIVQWGSVRIPCGRVGLQPGAAGSGRASPG